MLVPAIVSSAERTLLFPLRWSLALLVLRWGRKVIRCWGLGEEEWDRRRLRSKWIALGAGGVLVVILILIFGLMVVGELVKAAKSQLRTFLRRKRDATRLYDLSAEGRRTDHRFLGRGNGGGTYKHWPAGPVVGGHGGVDRWPGQGGVDWDFVCAIQVGSLALGRVVPPVDGVCWERETPHSARSQGFGRLICRRRRRCLGRQHRSLRRGSVLCVTRPTGGVTWSQHT